VRRPSPVGRPLVAHGLLDGSAVDKAHEVEAMTEGGIIDGVSGGG
jgi:hypothetical protein